MATDIKAQVLGLNFANNILSAAPAGSLARANDVSVNSAGLLEPRRGFTAYGTFGSLASRGTSFGQFASDTYLIHRQTGSALAYGVAGTFTDYSGSYAAVSATMARMRFVQAAGNVYFNTSTGTCAITAIATTPAEAGVPPGLFSNVSATNKTTLLGAPLTNNVWFTYNTSVAYRYVFSIKDANNNVKQSAPSGRAVCRNRIYADVGTMVRAANVVTVTLAVPHGLFTNSIVMMSPTEGTFVAGPFTVTRVSDYVFTYPEVAANVANAVAHDFSITRDVSFFGTLPPGLTTSHYVEAFRSEMTTDSANEPSDALYKVFERYVTASDISSGSFGFIDICPESMLGDPLYTNPSEEGIAQANDRPPIGRDALYFADRLWLLNTTSRHRFELNLLGVTSPDGLQEDWTITIADKTYTAEDVVVAATDFLLVTTLATPALNIAATVDQFVYTINTQSALVVAYNITGPDDSVGRILIEERAIGGSAFRVYATDDSAAAALCWTPALPATSSATSQSDNSAEANGFAYSKLGQPESFPLLNTGVAGPKNANLLRGIGLRDRIYAFSDDGLRTISTTQEPFSVSKLAEAELYGADTVVTLSEAVWALTDQGVVRVTETGVTVVSRPIESELTKLFASGQMLTQLKTLAFAVAHESARQYILFLPSTATSTYCEQAYVYNTATQAWTRWTVAANCGIHDPILDVLLLCPTNANTTLRQRNARTWDDYQDTTFVVTLSSSSGKTLTLASTTGLVAGDRLDNGSAVTRVVSVDSSSQVTVEDTITWTPGALTATHSIGTEVVFNPVTATSPSGSKAFRDISVLFQQATMSTANVDISTDNTPGASTVPLTFTRFGKGAWGTSAWGDPHAVLRRIAPVPNGDCAQLTVGIRVREAGSYFQLAGFTSDFEPSGGKSHR